MTIADHPLHGSGRAALPHPALALGEPRQALVRVCSAFFAAMKVNLIGSASESTRTRHAQRGGLIGTRACVIDRVLVHDLVLREFVVPQGLQRV
jgi:hypothetical protein